VPEKTSSFCFTPRKTFMFNPSRDQARSFFLESWQKCRDDAVLTPLETIAADIVRQHPEYHTLLENRETALAKEYTPESGELNPFLHLSLHLAIEEQLSIDQPPGLRAAFARCQQRRGDRHEALHDVLECLGEIIFEAQRNRRAPDGEEYVAKVLRRAGRD